MENPRCSIECCSNLGLQPSTVRESRVPKVGENKPVGDIGRYGTENVLWLDVSMRNALLVNVVNSIEDLAYNPSYL